MSPIRPEGLDTLTLTAVALYTVGGEQSAPNLSDVTVTARDLGIELTVVSDSIPDPPDNPYETYACIRTCDITCTIQGRNFRF